jgi:hypothetical protein
MTTIPCGALPVEIVLPPFHGRQIEDLDVVVTPIGDIQIATSG